MGTARLVIGAGKPKWRAMTPVLAVLFVITIFGLIRAVQPVRDGQGGLVVIIGLAFLAPFGYLGLSMRNFRIVASGEEVRYTNWWGRTTRFDRTQISEVLIRTVRVGGQTFRTALVIGLDGSALARWGANGAAAERLVPLWQQLAVQPDESITDVFSAKELRR